MIFIGFNFVPTLTLTKRDIPAQWAGSICGILFSNVVEIQAFPFMCVVSEVILTEITDAHVILSSICHVKGELKLLVHLISSSDEFYFYHHDGPESTSLTHWVDNTASKVDLNYQKKVLTATTSLTIIRNECISQVTKIPQKSLHNFCRTVATHRPHTLDRLEKIAPLKCTSRKASSK